MLLKRDQFQPTLLEKCHDGEGRLWCTEMLKEYGRAENGFFLIHDNVIEPGASIGEHSHSDTEEIYVILSGFGTMCIDGVDTLVGPGDVCLTRGGHSHSLVNGPSGPMHFLVIGTRTQPR